MNETWKPIKHLFIILFIEGLILIPFFTAYSADYPENAIFVKLNGKKVEYYYTEKYNSAYFLRSGKEGSTDIGYGINEIDLRDSIVLDISEYEAYYKTSKLRADIYCKECRGKEFNYKKVTNSKVNIEIKRKNKTIYKGKYIKNLNKYIHEAGRYYFHIYSTRKDNFYTSVKTHISFYVIVGGGNLEERNKVISS